MWKTMTKNLEWLLIVVLLVGGCGVADEPIFSQGNHIPVASLNAPPVGLVNKAVILDAYGSYDPDGPAQLEGGTDKITEIEWYIAEAPAGSTKAGYDFGFYSLGEKLLGSVSFIPDLPGLYKIRLGVRDSSRTPSGWVEKQIQVKSSNTAPSAFAGLYPVKMVGETVMLDGSGSSDPDNDPLTYTWSLVDKPAGSLANVHNAITNTVTSSVLQHIDKAGNYVVRLEVSDYIAISTSEVIITVVDPGTGGGNIAPVANAGPDQLHVPINTRVTLGGSGTDVDNNPLTYRWTLSKPNPTVTSGTPTFSGADTPAPYFTPDESGKYTATLIVNDGKVDSAPDSVDIFVDSVSSTLTTITALQNALANKTFLIAHSSAPNGLLELYEFGPVGPGGSMFFAYIDPISAPSSRTGDWSVTSGGGYIVATDLYSISTPRTLNTAAPVNTTTILTMTGYAGKTGSLSGSSVENWIKVAPVTTADFSGKTVALDSNNINKYVFTTATTGQYTDRFGNSRSFTWGIASGGQKAVVTYSNGFTHSLYLTVRGAGGSVLREMAVVNADGSGVVLDGSLQNWVW